MDLKVADIGGPVHYADYGGDGPPFVLVHGLGANHASWKPVGGALARRGRILAPDLPGFGRTPPAGRSSSVTANRNVLSRFITEVAGSPAILVGNSMGGLISLLQAAIEPSTVAGLVLVDPALPRARGAMVDPVIAATFSAYSMPGIGQRFLKRRARTLGAEGIVRETLRVCTVDPSRVPSGAVDAMVEISRWRLQQPWAHTAFLQAARSIVGLVALNGRFETMVRRISAPALVVHGARDRLVSLQAARQLASVHPEWTLEVFEDIGHVPQLEAPDRFVACVESWLDTAGRAALLAARFLPH